MGGSRCIVMQADSHIEIAALGKVGKLQPVQHPSHVHCQPVRKITRMQKSTDKITWTCLGTKLRLDYPNFYDTLS